MREALPCRTNSRSLTAGEQSDERGNPAGARVPEGTAKPSDGLMGLAFGRAPAGRVFGRNVARAAATAASFRRKTDHARSAPLAAQQREPVSYTHLTLPTSDLV